MDIQYNPRSKEKTSVGGSETGLEQSKLADEIYSALMKHQVQVSPKFLYDSLGSKLFEAICELPEYYLTRTEAWIFKNYSEEIKRSVGTHSALIDLGAGNCEKAAKLFPVLQPLHYFPVDISIEFLRKAAFNLHSQFPMISVKPLEIDFSKSWTLPEIMPIKRKRFFYPGSSIGNFNEVEALDFLKNIRRHADHDIGLLIGVDLVKDKSILESAYDDSLGITAAFNLNSLHQINAIAATDFQVDDWKHKAFFNSFGSRMEMHLEAKKRVTVTWPTGQRVFQQGESIHTENSYKYTEEKFKALLNQAGFSEIQVWKDPKSWFLVCYAEVRQSHLWN